MELSGFEPLTPCMPCKYRGWLHYLLGKTFGDSLIEIVGETVGKGFIFRVSPTKLDLLEFPTLQVVTDRAAYSRGEYHDRDLLPVLQLSHLLS